MLVEHVDLVAGEFNEAAWRRQCGNGRLNIVEEAFADTDLPMPLLGAVPGKQADVLRISQASGLFRKMGSTSAWCIFPSFTTLWASCPEDLHHEVWLRVALVDHRGRLRIGRKA